MHLIMTNHMLILQFHIALDEGIPLQSSLSVLFVCDTNGYLAGELKRHLGMSSVTQTPTPSTSTLIHYQRSLLVNF